jgi:RNA polymerase sigma factor (sigma-70 family)
MSDSDFLAAEFELHRDHLRSVAYRLLGSLTEADDAVQDTWLRLTGADTSEVENLAGWLTTVVARVSLNMLRSRRHRHEQPVGDSWPSEAEAAASAGAPAGPGVTGQGGYGGDPEEEAVLADSVGLALLVVLDTLAPPERLAFVLHDMFAMPFAEVAAVLGRSPEATRQLASRARRRVRGAPSPDRAADLGRVARWRLRCPVRAAGRRGHSHWRCCQHAGWPADDDSRRRPGRQGRGHGRGPGGALAAGPGGW